MFKPALNGHRIPTEPIEKLEVEAASLGGGFIVRLTIRGKIETLVFQDEGTLTRYLTALLNAAALAQMSQAAQKAVGEATAGLPAVASATPTAAEPVKRKGGRPRLSEEEKAANRAKRLNAKASNGKTPPFEVIANPDEAAKAIEATA